MRIFYLLVLTTFLLINILLFIDAPYFTELTIFNFLPSFILIIIYFMHKVFAYKNIDWTSIDNIFFVLFYTFHFSYIYLYFLGISDYDPEVFWDQRYTIASIYLLTIAVSSFLIGFNISVKDTSLSFYSDYDFDYKKIYKISQFLIIIVFLAFWLPILSIVSLAFSDYKSLISVGELSPIGKLYWIGQYIAVGALALYYISRVKLEKPLLSDTVSFIAILYILGYFAIGDRGGFIFYAIIPLAIYNLFFKKVNMLKGIFLGVVVLSLSSILAVSRVNSVYNPVEAYIIYAQDADNNAVISALDEFGRSFKTIPLIMSYIPEQYDYWYGKSYYDALMITLPNFIGSRSSESLAAWLTSTAFGKDAYGRGGSILMESYGNFGLYGSIIFFIILGILSAKFYNNYKYSSNIYKVVIYIAFVAAICMWMRNSAAIVFRTVIWSLTISWLVIHIIPYLPVRKSRS